VQKLPKSLFQYKTPKFLILYMGQQAINILYILSVAFFQGNKEFLCPGIFNLLY